jgi:tetratricopeptide (TPR) repeat protein
MQDKSVLALASYNLATLNMRRTAFDRAERLAHESLELDNDNRAAQAGNYRLLGDVFYRRNDFRAAASFFQRSANLLGGEVDKVGFARALVGLGWSHLKNGDRVAGCSDLRRAHSLFVGVNCTKGIGDIEKYLAETHC